MNKLELIEAFKDQEGLTKTEAREIVNVFFDEISNSLADGGRVEIRGLCSFYVRKYQSYTGRNPKTGEAVPINPKKLPFFKCGKELKHRINKMHS